MPGNSSWMSCAAQRVKWFDDDDNDDDDNDDYDDYYDDDEELRPAVMKLYYLRPELLTASMMISLRLAYHLPRGVLPSVVCLSVIVKPIQLGRLGPLGAVVPSGKMVT